MEILTKSDLVSLKDEILKELKGLFQTSYASSKEWLKSNEVRELLKCSDGTLQKLRNNGKLPFTKIHGTIYYDRSDVNKLFVENSQDY